jgi:hypothetical protein
MERHGRLGPQAGEQLVREPVGEAVEVGEIDVTRESGQIALCCHVHCS